MNKYPERPCKHPTCNPEGPCKRQKRPKNQLSDKSSTNTLPEKNKAKKGQKNAKHEISLSKLKEKAQKVCNEFIRLRDAGKPCISCSGPANQAGHYIAVNLSSFLRYDARNIHLQCPGCNLFRHGATVAYRIGLVKRIGLIEVESLERDFIENRLHKWTRSELESIIEHYTKKIKDGI